MMIPCRDCPQRYIGQTSKKIETRITEHKNAIKRHDHLSLPAAHTYDNCHTFYWTETQLLGRAQTKHAREFKEAWYSIDANTINRHIEIPTIYFQLKTIRNNPTNKDNTMANDINPMTLLSTPQPNDLIIPMMSSLLLTKPTLSRQRILQPPIR